ncbi:MAG: dipeptidase [Oscillospiraceae bacterium]|nr:dipeptidase [Oscillospiraceae bacterium]
MKYIDLHCDTLCMAFETQNRNIFDRPEFMVDIKRLKEAKALAQFFAIYMPPQEWIHNIKPGYTDDQFIDELYGILCDAIAEHPDDIALAKEYKDMKINGKKGKVSAFLTLEDGRSINGSFEKFDKYYDMGVRLVSLTHNYENCFGYPNSPDSKIMNSGLKPFGKEAVEYMNDKGIIIDVSHLSDGGFWDVMELSKKPVVASHSCARALTPHPRNLTDEMIKAMAEKGGVCGINLCPLFVTGKDISGGVYIDESRLEDVVRHIMHLYNVGGSDFVAIGTDFDGIGGKLDIASPLDMDKLFDALLKNGMNAADVEKIAYKNAERLVRETLK